MKTKTLFGSSFAALVLLATATHAFGQEPAPIAVTVLAGGSFLKGDRTFNVGGTPMQTDYAKGGRLGFRGTMGLGSRWAVEGTYSYGRDNLRITDLSGAIPSTRGFGVKDHQFTGNVLYYLNQSAAKVKFFGTAGLGSPDSARRPRPKRLPLKTSSTTPRPSVPAISLTSISAVAWKRRWAVGTVSDSICATT